jgi:hypothetical protein
MKITKEIIEVVKLVLYNSAWLDLTEDQVEEIVENFPEDLMKMVHEVTLQGSTVKDESMEKAVLNQLSLSLVDKEWPNPNQYQDVKEAWDLQMRTAFQYHGYKARTRT